MIIMIRSIMKNYRNCFRYIIFPITYAMRNTSTLPSLMTMISNFTIFFIFQIFFLDYLLYKYNKIFEFPDDSCCSLINNFIFFFLNLIIFTAYALKDSQNFFIQSIPLYPSCLFSMFLD